MYDLNCHDTISLEPIPLHHAENIQTSEIEGMIFTIEPENDLFMMDDKAYNDHMLVTGSAVTLLTEGDRIDLAGDDAKGQFHDLRERAIRDMVKERLSDMNAAADKADGATNDDATGNGPTEFDILCGQSRVCANHMGNKRFQAVLDMYAPKYQAATTKQEKMMLTKEIVACIKEDTGGRFMKRKDGEWVEITDVAARDKVSHALRTKVASWKRQKANAEQQRRMMAEGNGVPRSPVRPTHRRRKRPSQDPSGCSAASIVTSGSDVTASSFDSASEESSAFMEELLRTQRSIFARMTQGGPQQGGSPHPLLHSSTAFP